MFNQPKTKKRQSKMKSMKMTLRRKGRHTKNAIRLPKKTTTFDVDISQEFNDIKQTFAGRLDKLDTKLDAFKDEISAWRQIFETKLTELNTNMRNMLERLAQHDFRFSEHDTRIRKLEDTSLQTTTKNETISNIAKFGWTAAKIALAVGAVIGAVGGCGWVLKILSVF